MCRRNDVALVVGVVVMTCAGKAQPKHMSEATSTSGRDSVGTNARLSFRRMLEFADWRPQVVVIPRGQCHFIELDVSHVPRRYFASSLRLQLSQLTGLARTGYAWLVRKGEAQVWYWDEDGLNGIVPADPDRTNGSKPLPEPLLRPPMTDGLHLVECIDGFEAVAIRGAEVHRTRWFRNRPNVGDWASFVRDSGDNPADQALPAAERANLSPTLPRGWKLATHLLRQIPAHDWVAAALAAVAGVVLIAGLLYEFKLDGMVAADRAELDRLARDHATTIALQKQIATEANYLEALQKARPNVLQLELMKNLAESGLLGETAKVSLAEWEFRNDRLRILFAVSEDTFNLTQFLTRLESLSMLKEIKLMPDTPPRTVEIQAAVTASAADAGRDEKTLK